MVFKEHTIQIVKGKIQSYVARESEPISKIIKYIKTLSKKYGITTPDLRQIIDEVKRETVEPFSYQPSRLERLSKLTVHLNLEG